MKMSKQLVLAGIAVLGLVAMNPSRAAAGQTVTVVVEVIDQSGQAVSGIKVTGTLWSMLGASSEKCTTGVGGICQMVLRRYRMVGPPIPAEKNATLTLSVRGHAKSLSIGPDVTHVKDTLHTR